ncbi:M1 family aminopeptidase [Oleisolibacter albus]|uniref:M1 family aminopeptidase n=1 Tax=Oleisolibacter albus TaxID=2171757 RepID=UPI000DF32BFE|nr:M1 family aminopeptidase [Oleisolibacter albus]
MLGRIAAFEFRYQLRQPAFWVCFIAFFLLTFLAITNDNVQIGSGGGTHANAPFAIFQTTAIMSLVGLFIPLAILPGALLRDPETGMAGLLYALPLQRTSFLLGRFLGAYAIVALAFLGAPLGTMLGSVMWWLDPETLGPFRAVDYVHAVLIWGWPNLLITGALFFATAALSRSQWAVYGVMLALLVAWVVTGKLLDGPEVRELVAITDPFGLRAAGQMTRYWTTFERNTQLVPLEGILLWNRLLWLGIAVALVGLALASFRFQTQPRGGRRRKAEPVATEPVSGDLRLVGGTPAPAGRAGLAQFLAQSRLEAVSVMKSPGFLVMLALGLFNAVGALSSMDALYGTPIYPVSRMVVDLLAGSFGIIPVIVVIYYTAELVWRDRQTRMHELVQSCPVPGWVFVASKLLAMVLVLLALFAAAALAGIITQLVAGPTPIEPRFYLAQMLVFTGIPILHLAVLSLFIQVLVPNKYLGMLAMVGYMLLGMVAEQLGLVDNLVIFGDSPTVRTSDMNGFGHFAEPTLWFLAYWSFAALVLVAVAHRLWPSGVPAPLAKRLRSLAHGWTGGPAVLAAAGLAGFLLTGGWIAYNTHGLNDVRSPDSREADLVAYEKAYRQYEGLPQPRITDVRVDLDLFPETRGYQAKGVYVLENRTGVAVPDIHIQFDQDIVVTALEVEGGTPKQEDRHYNHFIHQLAVPMQPGEKRTLRFAVKKENPGFTNDAEVTPVVYNGSFLNNTAVAPFIGFSRAFLLQDRNARRKHGLDPIDRMAKLDDQSQWRNNYLREDSDWVRFETTVSTSADQTVIAPGYAQKEWVENGRRYVHYAMDAPILNFYSWLSARYSVARDSWNGVDLSVYYHEPHAWNVPRMLDAMKKSLAYFSGAFSPYQHRQMRILEFPAYATFAQSFPNTVPYSEGIGFIADNRDPEDIDYVFYVTAHEVAHQWWAHQVMGANVQGSTLLSETLAQYSALLVMEQEYGPDKIRKFLKYELDRYLRGRGGEEREEQPLMLVENQAYIHYRKGAIVMYALKDLVGEETVNRALARLVKETAYRSDPYPRSVDLVRILKEEVGPDRTGLIEDLFEKIVLYDLKPAQQTVEPTADGKLKVTLTLDAAKVEADGQGKETPRTLDDWIDIGVFKADPSKPAFSAADVLYLKKHRIERKDQVIEIEVDRSDRLWIGVDPYNKLIDRNSDDNVVSWTAP